VARPSESPAPAHRNGPSPPIPEKGQLSELRSPRRVVDCLCIEYGVGRRQDRTSSLSRAARGDRPGLRYRSTVCAGRRVVDFCSSSRTSDNDHNRGIVHLRKDETPDVHFPDVLV